MKTTIGSTARRAMLLSGAALLLMFTAVPAPAADGHGHDEHGKGAAAAAKGKDAPAAKGKGAAPAKEAHGDEDGHGEEKSDLDRSVRELWEARCEHDMAQYGCDECRYEVGVVKVPASLFGKDGKGGIVRSVLPATGSFSGSRSFRGEVVRNEAAAARVASPLPGRLVRLAVRPGQEVKAGDVVAELDSQELSDAKGDLVRKHVAVEVARKGAEREKRLFEKKISAEVEVQEAVARLAAAEVDLSSARSRLLRMGVAPEELSTLDPSSPAGLPGTLLLKSPRDGRVAVLHAAQGEYVEAGKEVVELSDPAEAKVEAILSEGDLSAFSRTSGGYGIPAEVVSGRSVLKGTLEVRTAVVDEKTRTFRARVAVSDPKALLRPGTFVSVRIASGRGGTALTVPRTAVLSDEGRSFVFVRKEGEFWIRRPVKTGRRLGASLEILSGLNPGQEVIADGSFVLKSDVLRAKMGAGCAD
jgi:cobalt-zinc-cadmium efflux system membrane fusion protein